MLRHTSRWLQRDDALPQFHTDNAMYHMCVVFCCGTASGAARLLAPRYDAVVSSFHQAAAAMRTSLEFASRLNQLPHAKADEDQSAGIC